MNQPRHIGVFTSGGDAPGMNAAIRAVVRSSVDANIRISGIMRGYEGMMAGEFVMMDSRSVSNIIQRGGTILKTARSAAFMTAEGRAKAYQNIVRHDIDALVAIGGDGTFKGAEEFCSEYPDIRIIGIPGTIDNDLSGTDYTLGFDTAVNTTIEAIDKIRDTAASHDRCFFVEVMGRDSGCIALWSGLAGGAEWILLPEVDDHLDLLVSKLEKGAEVKKSSSIIVVAECDKNGGAHEIAKQLKARLQHYETKVTVLGHVQRGGSPTAFDRILAARFGIAAVKALINGENRQMVGLRDNKISFLPLAQATRQHNPIDPEMLDALALLSI